MSKIYTFDSLSDLENYINQFSHNDIAIYAEAGIYHVRLFDKLNTNVDCEFNSYLNTYTYTYSYSFSNTNEITVTNAELAYHYYNINYESSYNQAYSMGQPLPVYDENQIFNMKSIAYKLNNNLYKRINKAGNIDKTADIANVHLSDIINNHESQDLNINGLVDNLINKHATNRTPFTANSYWQW